MRLASSRLLPHLTTVFVTACSDDGNDAAPIDADPPGDCGCTDLADAAPDSGPGDPWSFPGGEGGELRLERFQLGPDDAEAELAAQALFFEGQDPPARSLNGKLIAIRPELEDKGYACQDFSDGNNFENGSSPQAQAVVDSRTYFDVGATATLTNADDDSDVITLNKFLGDENPAAATDRSAGLVHEILYKAPLTTPVERNARYLPAIMGSDDYPMLDLKYGESVTGDTLAEPAPADWPTIVPFIGFVNDTGMIEAQCLKFTPGDAEDGSFTVPYEVLDYVQADPGGHAVFGRLVHTAWETQPDRARLDLVDIESKVSPGFVIQDAPPARR